jgi:transcriptional regulator with XRE-family HTH domain
MSKYILDFGFTIKTLRTRKKISTRCLAKLTGLSASTISQVEIGGRNLSIKTAEKIAHGLGFNFEKFVQITMEIVKEKEKIDEAISNLEAKITLLLQET